MPWWDDKPALPESLPWLSKDSKGETVAQPEDDEEPSSYRWTSWSKDAHRKPIFKRMMYWSLSIVALLIIALGGVLLFNRQSSNHSVTSAPTPHAAHSHDHDTPPNAGKKYEDCGSTPTEARERGCVFEPQLTAWNPSACVFPELIDEYTDTVGDMHAEWNWFWDKNCTDPVPPSATDSLRAGNYTAIYTDYASSHPLHCLYCWRKVMFALQHGHKMMDTRCHQFWHAKHCVEHVAGRLQVQQDITRREKWSYPLMFHGCVELASTEET